MVKHLMLNWGRIKFHLFWYTFTRNLFRYDSSFFITGDIRILAKDWLSACSLKMVWNNFHFFWNLLSHILSTILLSGFEIGTFTFLNF